MVEVAVLAGAAGAGVAGVITQRLTKAARAHGRVVRWERARGGAKVHIPSTPPVPLAYGPAVAIAPLAVLALVRPWGPLSDAAGVLAAVTAASLSLWATGQVAHLWTRRRMRDLFPDWLAFLSVAMDLGMPLGAALAVAAAGVEEPLGPRARSLADAAAAGEPGPALEAYASAIGTPEAAFVVSVLGRSRRLGVSIASLLLEEEGLLSRVRWQERRARQGIVPYAFTVAVGVLLVNAAVLFLVPRAAALLGTFGTILP